MSAAEQQQSPHLLHPESDDFSMRWFGIPTKDLVKFWDKLERLPKPSPHREGERCWCPKCANDRMCRAYERAAELGIPPHKLDEHFIR